MIESKNNEIKEKDRLRVYYRELAIINIIKVIRELRSLER